MRSLLVLMLGLALSGCFTTGKRGGETALTIYDFGPLPASKLTAPRQPPLALEVRAPLWFDTMGIGYRLAYIDAARLREYAKARWAGPPAQLIQQRLLQQLGYTQAGQAQSRCLLRLEIAEFSQVFIDRDESRGVLTGRALLFDRKRQLLAELPLRLHQAAPTPNARGAVAAMTATVERLADELLRWEQQQVSGPAAACFA